MAINAIPPVAKQSPIPSATGFSSSYKFQILFTKLKRKLSGLKVYKEFIKESFYFVLQTWIKKADRITIIVPIIVKAMLM